MLNPRQSRIFSDSDLCSDIVRVFSRDSCLDTPVFELCSGTDAAMRGTVTVLSISAVDMNISGFVILMLAPTCLEVAEALPLIFYPTYPRT